MHTLDDESEELSNVEGPDLRLHSVQAEDVMTMACSQVLIGSTLKLNQSLKNKNQQKMKLSSIKKIFVYSSTTDNNLSMMQIAQKYVSELLVKVCPLFCINWLNSKPITMKKLLP